MSPWRRAGTVLAIVAALGGFTWLETVVPGYASLGIAILAAIAWCRWLEQHAEISWRVQAMSTSSTRDGRPLATGTVPDRTHTFARVIGPWLVLVPGVLVLRTPDIGALVSGFFGAPILVWFAGALLLFGGIVIIAFHQYWSNPAAILISLFGWFLALRGLALLAIPRAMERAVDVSARQIVYVRFGFGVLAAIGLYLAYVGWIVKSRDLVEAP